MESGFLPLSSSSHAACSSSMEVRLMMPDVVFSEHANDDAEKAGELCHVITCLYYTMCDT